MSEPGKSNGSRSPLANLLTVGVMVVALACLVIPAIVAARASSRQMKCADNIKQIAMALINHAQLDRRFPAGTIANEQLAPESRLSWYPSIWPYLEAGPELMLDREKAWDDQSNIKLRIRFWSNDEEDYVGDGYYGGYELFRCPDLEPAIKFGNLIQTAYVGPSGVGQESLVSAATHPQDGIWGYDRSTALDHVCNGLDNTVLLLESSVKNGPWTAGGPATVRDIEETDEPVFGIGRQLGGLHAGITNVAFADGSMKPMNDDVDMRVLVELVGVCDSQKTSLGAADGHHEVVGCASVPARG